MANTKIPPPFGPGSMGWERHHLNPAMDWEKAQSVKSARSLRSAHSAMSGSSVSSGTYAFSLNGEDSGWKRSPKKARRSQAHSPMATRAHSFPARKSPMIVMERRRSLHMSPRAKSMKYISPNRRSSLCRTPRMKGTPGSQILTPDRRSTLCMTPSQKSKSLEPHRRDSLCMTPTFLPQAGLDLTQQDEI